MSRRTAMELTRRIVAVVAMAALAYPPGATSVMRWAADHDMVDVPWVRDCHGIYRHPDECPSRSEARSISY